MVRESSLGWTAQFEVYSTRLQKGRIEEDWRFDIDPDEVLQHIQKFSKTITLDPTEPAYRSTRKDLALHFPISIGNNLEVFTVLRKVYIRTSSRDSSSSNPHKAHQHWRVLSIPVEHSQNSTLLRCFSKPFSERENLDAADATWKSASVKVDDLTAFRLVAHNEYILYYALRGTSVTRNSSFWRNIEEKKERDDDDDDDDNCSVDTAGESSVFNQSETVPEAECMASSIAVFRVVGAEQKEEICLIDYLKNAGDDEYIVRCAFHPHLPLLVFHGVSGHIGKIVLWSFRSFECSRQGFQTIPRFETLVKRKLHWTESLQFSPCGQQVVFEEYSADCPTIIPVGESTLYRMAQEILPETGFGSGAGKVQSMSLAGDKTLSQNKMILHDAENITQLDFHPNSTHSDLDLVKISEGFQIVQPLISLPKQPGIQHANISILPASDRNETMIRMIITKSPKLFCSLADADKDTSPVIVGKEAQGLLLAKQRKIGSESLRDWKSLMPIMSVASGVFKTEYSMIQAPGRRLQLSKDESRNMKHEHTPIGMDQA